MRNAASATTAVVASSARGLTDLWASTRWAWTYGRNGRQSARTHAPGMIRPVKPAGSRGGPPHGDRQRPVSRYARAAARAQSDRRRTLAAVSHYPRAPLPRFFGVRQMLPRDRVDDVAASVRTELQRIGLTEQLKPAASVAITAGSRGIADIPLVIRTVANVVREAGGDPFVVPAM